MKRNKFRPLFTLVLLIVAAAIALTACKPVEEPEPTKTETVTVPTTEPAVTDSEAAQERVFQDSAGRDVILPAQLTHMVPSGPLAQIVLFTVATDLIGAVAHPVTETQLKLLGEGLGDLPSVGQLYGKGDGFNLEAALMANTQVIVDIGEAKASIKEDLDEITEQINLPTVFIEATFASMPRAFRDLGQLIGNSERTDLLAAYCEQWLALSEKAKETIPEAERVSVYWAMGEAGLNTNAVGSFHSELLDYVPVINVADVEAANRGGGSEVSMEQIIGWQPDYILVDGANLADEMREDPAWSSLSAVREGRVIVIPSAPYGFLADPPSVNRYAGLAWLGPLFYPQVYGSDVKGQVAEFFSLFYGVELDDASLDAVLDGSYH